VTLVNRRIGVVHGNCRGRKKTVSSRLICWMKSLPGNARNPLQIESTTRGKGGVRREKGKRAGQAEVFLWSGLRNEVRGEEVTCLHG